MAVLDELTGGLGLDTSGFFSGAGNIATVIVVFLVVGGLIGGLTFFILNRRSYTKRIHIFEEVSGVTQPVGEDQAREVALPNTSTRAFYLRHKKIYLPRPSIQTGANRYWYFIRADGEWMNVRPTNLNAKMKELDLHYDHSDMRMANASLKKLVESNYKKTNWIKEYAPYIAIGLLILLLGIVFFLILKEVQKAIAPIQINANIQNEILGKYDDILLKLDNILSNSGARVVETT